MSVEVVAMLKRYPKVREYQRVYKTDYYLEIFEINSALGRTIANQPNSTVRKMKQLFASTFIVDNVELDSAYHVDRVLRKKLKYNIRSLYLSDYNPYELSVRPLSLSIVEERDCYSRYIVDPFDDIDVSDLENVPVY